MTSNQEWFGIWFNSPYYHLLYRNRDHQEAQSFINNLKGVLKFKKGQKALDIACGKGRHSIYLNSLGLKVTGIDLSPENITYAQQKYGNPSLQFKVHDMRLLYKEQHFDLAFNLFTSFGYFDTHEEHKQAVLAAAAALVSGGKLVIDFLNPNRVIERLVPMESKVIDGVTFRITRDYKQGFIIKNIEVQDGDHKLQFMEQVQAIKKFEFMRYFVAAELKLLGNYGDYDLNPFNSRTSPRMIFVLEKE
jgi:SAM-dependent methyltransferase